MWQISSLRSGSWGNHLVMLNKHQSFSNFFAFDGMLCSCLFLPSLATVKGATADSIPTGGIGGGKWRVYMLNTRTFGIQSEENVWSSSSHVLDCRGFPPVAGLSFTCWFQINRFSSACDSHPIRLLSVVRHMSRTEQQYICLSISFSAYDGCLVVSTEEEALTYLGRSDKSLVNICPWWTFTQHLVICHGINRIFQLSSFKNGQLFLFSCV